MKAMVIDDEGLEEIGRGAPVERIKSLLTELGVAPDPCYEFVGKLGADDFVAQVRDLDVPPDIAVIDYGLHWEDAVGADWNGDRVGAFLRERWADDTPFYILFYSRYLRSTDTPYEKLVGLLRVPFAGYVDLASRDWEKEFRSQVKWGCNVVQSEQDRAIRELAAAGDTLDLLFKAGIMGHAPSLLEMERIVSRVSGTDAVVLITGETGTGKELVAKAIHYASPREGEPFVAVNCGAIPENLLESELFGCKKGAFTDAVDRPGLFRIANRGTIFLDEIGDTSLQMQVKLLRVLQERMIRPVGETKEIPIDVRVIAATNVNLAQMVAEKKFRDDLYHRLNVIPIQVPPLRERGRDVLQLARVFLRKFAAEHKMRVSAFSSGAERALRSHNWPGNVRELENTIERAVVLCNGEKVDVTDLKLSDLYAGNVPQGDTWLEAEEEFKRSYFKRVLRECGGNITHAAKKAALSRTHFSKTLKRLGLNVPKD